MEIQKLLPIGSVVRLKNGTKRLMIYGIKQTDGNSGKEYDYIGVFYPEGNLGQEGRFFFNDEDVEQISFLGLNDQERQVFLQRLSAFYEQREEQQP